MVLRRWFYLIRKWKCFNDKDAIKGKAEGELAIGNELEVPVAGNREGNTDSKSNSRNFVII